MMMMESLRASNSSSTTSSSSSSSSSKGGGPLRMLCGERLWKLRRMFILASIPMGLIFLVYTLMPTHSHLHRHHQLDFANVHPHGNEFSSSISSRESRKNIERRGGNSAANWARERAHRESDEYLTSSSSESSSGGAVGEEPSSLHTAHEEEEDVHVRVHVGGEEE